MSWLASNPAGGAVGRSCAGAPASIMPARIASQLRKTRNNVKAKVSPPVPPICRNRVRSLVAAPISATGTAFWTATVKVAIDGPISTPAMNIHSHSVRAGASARRLVMSRCRPPRRQGTHRQPLVVAGSAHQDTADHRARDRPEQERQELIARFGGTRALRLVPDVGNDGRRALDPGRGRSHHRRNGIAPTPRPSSSRCGHRRADRVRGP
jgi:hypothetical protein